MRKRKGFGAQTASKKRATSAKGGKAKAAKLRRHAKAHGMGEQRVAALTDQFFHD